MKFYYNTVNVKSTIGNNNMKNDNLKPGILIKLKEIVYFDICPPHNASTTILHYDSGIILLFLKYEFFENEEFSLWLHCNKIITSIFFTYRKLCQFL